LGRGGGNDNLNVGGNSGPRGIFQPKPPASLHAGRKKKKKAIVRRYHWQGKRVLLAQGKRGNHDNNRASGVNYHKKREKEGERKIFSINGGNTGALRGFTRAPTTTSCPQGDNIHAPRAAPNTEAGRIHKSIRQRKGKGRKARTSQGLKICRLQQKSGLTKSTLDVEK